MNVLVLNLGGNSLKLEVIACSANQVLASNGRKLASVSVEGIGKKPFLSVFHGKRVVRQQPIRAVDVGEAASGVISWLEEAGGIAKRDIDCTGIRVVHGGEHFDKATPLVPEVEREIEALERLAPLHNKSSLELLDPVRRALGNVPTYAVFDTSFHRAIPDVASHYAIPLDLAKKHGIRRYGFHGTSHRFMMERAACRLNKQPADINLVTMHLESGCSVTAIEKGRSIDNTMGFTPLEGLMMGTRSGDVDPSVIPFLVREERMQIEDVMTLLNKKSGLLAVSGKSLDTRVLMQDYGKDTRVTLAIDMFCYRVVKAVGACLSALGGADAIVFGGGIGENTPLLREQVCASLRWCGLHMDPKANRELIDCEGRLSTRDSSFHALVVLTEEGLQIAHECAHASCIQQPL
jgi:acetate kinase